MPRFGGMAEINVHRERHLRKEAGQQDTAGLPPEPYLTSVHAMQVMLRLLVVIRFKATDVSLSEVGCAPHLKKNSWKNEGKKSQYGPCLVIYPFPNIFSVSNHLGAREELCHQV